MTEPKPARRVAHRRRSRLAMFALAMFASGGAVVLAAGSFGAGATTEVQAVRTIPQVGDVAVAFDVGDVDRFVLDAAIRAVTSVGGVGVPGRTGSLGMQRITRGGATVHAPPAGYLIPMVYTALPRGAIGGVIGADVAPLLESDTAVMNELTAGLTGARVGDVVVMQAANASTVPITIAGIRPYEQLGGAELVFTTDVADRLGATADTRVVMWGFGSRSALDAALEREGVLGRTDTKVNRSWDPADPDDTLSTARAKAMLGEPWYRFASDGSIVMHPDWKAANLAPGRELLNSTIRIRAQCHKQVVGDLRAALADVVAAGLAGAIDVANANSYGGCYIARFSRVSGQIGFLSRHTYGMALDTNTLSNCGGCRPQMNCDVVRIFRRHGFAWGGNFRRPDGMHFEWVGERRDQISYPSTYCPNVVQPLAQSQSGATVGMGVLVDEDASVVHEDPHGT